MVRLWRAVTAAGACLVACCSAAAAQHPWVHVFNGTDLAGWREVGGSAVTYKVDPGGVLECPAGCNDNLFTEKNYSDFAFRFQFKLSPAGNNGIGIRAPFQGDAAYMGMEVQVLDDSSPDYAHLEPGQYHGSIYKVWPAKRGAERPVGQWNSEEIVAKGRHIRVIVNGITTVDAWLNRVTDPQTMADHPGMLRSQGHIGFLGHGPSTVWFRNVYLQDLGHQMRDNHPPAGFKALFDGHSLRGWKGLVADPPTRHKMTPEALAAATKKATAVAFQHWKVADGAITYDGRNNNLCTVKQYGNFEMMVDWKIPPKGDSGIYLRGSPQVQIWDNPLGSGGLYNNIKGPSNPLVFADHPIGQWNHFRIVMVGDRVTVYLNHKLVVNNVVMENYWERSKPIYPVE
ncbi:MAG: DUF1080 domain-containing protein, partial [Armatimonadetes bacterium]|nr:DUF1080 domain-containing protein [Armatimonadota bacterium]